MNSLKLVHNKKFPTHLMCREAYRQLANAMPSPLYLRQFFIENPMYAYNYRYFNCRYLSQNTYFDNIQT